MRIEGNPRSTRRMLRETSYRFGAREVWSKSMTCNTLPSVLRRVDGMTFADCSLRRSNFRRQRGRSLPETATPHLSHFPFPVTIEKPSPMSQITQAKAIYDFPERRYTCLDLLARAYSSSHLCQASSICSFCGRTTSIVFVVDGLEVDLLRSMKALWKGRCNACDHVTQE